MKRYKWISIFYVALLLQKVYINRHEIHVIICAVNRLSWCKSHVQRKWNSSWDEWKCFMAELNLFDFIQCRSKHTLDGFGSNEWFFNITKTSNLLPILSFFFISFFFWECIFILVLCLGGRGALFKYFYIAFISTFNRASRNKSISLLPSLSSFVFACTAHTHNSVYVELKE